MPNEIIISFHKSKEEKKVHVIKLGTFIATNCQHIICLTKMTDFSWENVEASSAIKKKVQ